MRKNNFILPRYIYGVLFLPFLSLSHALSRLHPLLSSLSLSLSILNKQTHTHTHTYSLSFSLYLSIYIYISFFSLVLYPGPGSSTPPFSIKGNYPALSENSQKQSKRNKTGERRKQGETRRGRDRGQSWRKELASWENGMSTRLTRALKRKLQGVVVEGRRRMGERIMIWNDYEKGVYWTLDEWAAKLTRLDRSSKARHVV